MGLFDRLFGNKKSKARMESISEMLDEEVYWDIVDDSLANSKNKIDQEQYLIRTLRKLSPKEMIGFELRSDKFRHDTYTSELWCAAYIMNGGCSDDGFEYFRNWIISRGKEVYYKAKENPDSLVSVEVGNGDYYDFESFSSVALVAFQQVTGENLYDYISEDFHSNLGDYKTFEFNWEEEDPETMRAICPQLFEAMW